jgi:hypothetical protein
MAVVIVLAGIGFVGVRYAFREDPGPKSLSAAVKAFAGAGPITARRNLSYEPPTQGVYALHGQGTERISLPPNSQRDGSVMPASVKYLTDGCWRWHVDYNIAHWEEYDFCPRGTQLLLVANRNSQSWDFGTLKINNLAHITCPPITVVLPGDPKSGQVLGWSCIDTNTATPGRAVEAITARIVGIDTVRVGGADVPTIHELQQVTLTGGQRGTASVDWWFATRSGLPVRGERHITIMSSSPIGTVTYHEDGSWQMTSLQPRT